MPFCENISHLYTFCFGLEAEVILGHYIVTIATAHTPPFHLGIYIQATLLYRSIATVNNLVWFFFAKVRQFIRQSPVRDSQVLWYIYEYK